MVLAMVKLTAGVLTGYYAVEVLQLVVAIT